MVALVNVRRGPCSWLRLSGWLIVAMLACQGTAYAQRAGRSGDCLPLTDGQAYLYPVPIQTLVPLCTTVLECEALSAQQPLPAAPNSAFANWLSRADQARQQRACDQARSCLAAASNLVQQVSYPVMSGPPRRPYPIYHPDWRARSWAAELASGLQASTGGGSVGLPGRATCPRIATDNHLRRPLQDRLEMAIEFTRHVYGTQCDTVAGCLAATLGGELPWEQESLWQAELDQVEREAARAEAAGTLAIEAQMQAHNQVLAQQVQAIDTHAQALSTAQRIAGLTVATAVNESLLTDPDSNENLLNLTDATLRLADNTGELALGVQSGLTDVADAIHSAADAQRATDPTAVARQIDPEADLAGIYPNAKRIDYGILLVPDPRIPRHRRGYDLSLAAVGQGMLGDDYVLDRYAVPWQSYIDALGNGGKDKAQEGQLAADSKYGIFVYRRDAYRDNGSERAFPDYDLRVLYVIGESGTFGVQQQALARALLRIERVVTRPATGCSSKVEKTVHGRMHYAGGHFKRSATAGSPIWAEASDLPNAASTLIIGPSFSGSLSSIASAHTIAVEDLKPGEGGLTSAADLRKLASSIQSLDLVVARSTTNRVAISKLRAQARLQQERYSADRRWNERELLDLKQSITAISETANRKNDREIGDAFEAIECQLHWTRPHRQPDSEASQGDPVESASESRAQATAPTPRLALRLVSATTTASSNYQAGPQGPIEHHSLAIPDSIKLDVLSHRFPGRCGSDSCAERDVVIFSEASTFGRGLCGASPKAEICLRAYEIPFPANIADIRALTSERQRHSQQQARDALGIPEANSFLDLAQGAENGSEFPDSQRSALTSATVERELEQALRQVTAVNPRLVIVAATDVRDRIFLFDRLRQAAPRALLVDLEADVLMTHPRVIHATRGMLLLSSGPLQPPPDERRLEGFANDDQWAVFEILKGLSDARPNTTATAGPLLGYVPSRRGLKWVWSENLPAQWRPDDGTPSKPVPHSSGLLRLAALASPPLLSLLFLAAMVRRRTTQSGEQAEPEFLARIGSASWDGWSKWLLVLILAVIVLIKAAFVTNPEHTVPNIFLFAAETGFSYGVAMSVSITSVLLLCFFSWRSRIYSRQLEALDGTRVGKMRLSAKAPVEESSSNESENMRPAILCDVRHSRRFLPGADIVSWPLYVTAVLWAWMVAGSATHSWCPLCWPRTSVLPPFAELVLMLLVALLLLMALHQGSTAIRLFRQILAVADRAKILVGRSGQEEMTDWSSLPPVHQRWQQTPTSMPDEQLISSEAESDATQRQAWLQPRFARTPFLSLPGDYAWPYAALGNGKAGIKELRQSLRAMESGYVDCLENRLALALVFSTMIANMRLRLISAMTAGVTVVAIGYLYPVTDRDQYLLFALAILMLAVGFIGQTVLVLERVPLISRLTCNTKAGLNLNWPTVASIGGPLLLLLASIYVIESPGVLQWSDGLFSGLLNWFGG